MVKTLREQTGVGMMECKKALQEADGDLRRAAALLREKGEAKAVKRAGRAANEGRIQGKVREDERAGVLVEVNTETDFAARSDRFAELVERVSQTALACRCSSRESLLAAKPEGTDAKSVEALVAEAIGVIGENIGVSRCERLEAPEGKSGLVHTYIHPPGRVGVAVVLDCENDKVARAEATRDLAHNLCLHIAFSNPAGLDNGSIPQDVIEAEREIYRNAAIKQGKPEKLLDKIVEGRLRAFFKESCLLEQAYVKDEEKSVKQLIEETAKTAGGALRVNRYVRCQLGEAATSEEA
jgi:elongation factor Ts